MSRCRYSVIAILLAINSISAIAQNVAISGTDFSFFGNEDYTSSTSASSVPGSNSGRGRGTLNIAAAPTFILVGTSRIGDSQSAILKHLNREAIRVPLTGIISQVPGYESYSIISHSAGQVRLSHPSSDPCTNFSDQGVSCDPDTNIATLSLTTTAKAMVATVREPPDEPQGASDEAEELPQNPFEVIRESGRGGLPR